MPSVLIIGYDPEFVDFNDPGPPQGLNKDMIWAGAEKSLQLITGHGWKAVQCMVRPDESAVNDIERALSRDTWSCIVIGGGVRMSQNSVPVFEAILDTIRRVAPDTPIAFNAKPDGSLEAAQRWIKTS
ncbi:hypothetical protein [Winslowiella iniecta]|uniref:Uncharacterized protein n=1 Tax=Winslowiella iniecta TaxID=1560201 RepID=A0A0L7TFN9_9GAMM|nr:hypothetical protein [Winslowiella iniecta]KOC88168.1 hypothetical protein NG42_17410 [Winslowiella iniecta]KOC94192.1 hypothetical protein NG43_05820 [Winslowiella iniecta]